MVFKYNKSMDLIESVSLCLTFFSKLCIICLSKPKARPCSPFAQNTWASSSCHDDTGIVAQAPPPLCCFIWKTACSARWTQITTMWIIFTIFTWKNKNKYDRKSHTHTHTTCVFPALRANWQSSMRWSVSTELRYWVLSRSPALDISVCWATERAARMGSTKAKSLSVSSWECCRHWLQTFLSVTSEKGLMEINQIK